MCAAFFPTEKAGHQGQAVPQSQSVPEGRSFGCSYSVTFRVQVPSDFHGVAGLPLLDVLVHGRLQQIGVLPL